jgi:hypothetical protein
MLTGHVVFRGSPAQVMYQHRHAPLPLDLLEDVPQPLVVLLDVLLEKDPGRRFQNPAELLKAIPEIADAIDTRRRITRQSLQKTPSTASRVGTRRPKSRLGPKKISVARLPVTGSGVFGREEDIAFLDAAWANKQVNVVTFYVLDSERGDYAKLQRKLAQIRSHGKGSRAGLVRVPSCSFFAC